MRGWSFRWKSRDEENSVLPAHAGVILVINSLIVFTFCTSRTCGGDPETKARQDTQAMYFPHMRGWSSYIVYCPKSKTVLPAHAGVIPKYPKILIYHRSTSRTCGGDPGILSSVEIEKGYFPHMRGWSYVCSFSSTSKVVLPAHAGVILCCW